MRPAAVHTTGLAQASNPALSSILKSCSTQTWDRVASCTELATWAGLRCSQRPLGGLNASGHRRNGPSGMLVEAMLTARSSEVNSQHRSFGDVRTHWHNGEQPCDLPSSPISTATCLHSKPCSMTSKARAVDRTVNLGDCVSGPLWPRETMELLDTLGLLTVRGIQDR